MYVTQIVGNDYRWWKSGDAVFIECPTGTGKTQFIMKTLLPYAEANNRRILYLSNRFMLKEQIKVQIAEQQDLPLESDWLEAVEEFQGITVISYQKLQEICKRGRAGRYLDTRQYQLVVWDEVHYLIEDAAFNPEVYWSLQFLLKCSATNIFLSATMEDIQRTILELKYEGSIIWQTKRQWSQYCSICEMQSVTRSTMGYPPLMYFYQMDTIKNISRVNYFQGYEEIIDEINFAGQEEKWLIFMSNKKKARDLQKRIDNAEVLTSENTDCLAMREIIENEKFSCRVLIATKILDNGITIKDRDLNHIVIDTISRVEFLQMAGRKRFVDNEDMANLYIPKKDVRYFTGYLHTNLNQLMAVLNKNWLDEEIAEQLLHDEENAKLIKTFFCWDNGKFVKNPLAEEYYSMKKRFLVNMVDKMKKDPYAFVKQQLRWLGISESFSEDNALIFRRRERLLKQIENLMRGLCMQSLESDEQSTLRKEITKLAKAAGIQNSAGNRNMGLKLINEFCSENGISYYVESKEGKKKGQKTVWIVKEAC